MNEKLALGLTHFLRDAEMKLGQILIILVVWLLNLAVFVV